jgi:hypothetical protein
MIYCDHDLIVPLWKRATEKAQKFSRFPSELTLDMAVPPIETSADIQRRERRNLQMV